MIGVAAILREHGRSALITQTTTGRTDEHTAPYLSTIADAILNLDYSLETYEMDRTMRLIKMRGSQHASHPYRLFISGGGVHVEALTPGMAARYTPGSSG